MVGVVLNRLGSLVGGACCSRVGDEGHATVAAVSCALQARFCGKRRDMQTCSEAYAFDLPTRPPTRFRRSSAA